VFTVIFHKIILYDRPEDIVGLYALESVVVNAAVSYHSVIGIRLDAGISCAAALEAVYYYPVAAGLDVNVVDGRAVQDGFVFALRSENGRLLCRAGVFRSERDLFADVDAGGEYERI
jgi:hypothetical protein